MSAAHTFETLLAGRHSCRGFRSEPVPRELLRQAAAMAQRTASWCNAQPWQLVIASPTATERLRQRLSDHVTRHAALPDYPWPEAYLGVHQERRRECGLQLYRAVGVERGDREGAERQRMENFRFFGAPNVALVTCDGALGTYGAVDCGAFVNNFMLSAHALGIATIAQAALAAYPDFWRGELALPAARRVVCGISLGYEDAAHPANGFRTSRAAIDDVLHWVD